MGFWVQKHLIVFTGKRTGRSLGFDLSGQCGITIKSLVDLNPSASVANRRWSAAAPRCDSLAPSRKLSRWRPIWPTHFLDFQSAKGRFCSMRAIFSRSSSFSMTCSPIFSRRWPTSMDCLAGCGFKPASPASRNASRHCVGSPSQQSVAKNDVLHILLLQLAKMS